MTSIHQNSDSDRPAKDLTSTRKVTLIAKLAAFFRQRPHTFHDGRELGAVCGYYGWRTKVSQLRRSPWLMQIENRQRRVARPDGSHYVISEYRYLPTDTHLAAPECKPVSTQALAPTSAEQHSGGDRLW
jgi:hypothetical protein